MPNVLCASVLIIITRPGVFVRSCVAVCAVKIHTFLFFGLVLGVWLTSGLEGCLCVSGSQHQPLLLSLSLFTLTCTITCYMPVPL